MPIPRSTRRTAIIRGAAALVVLGLVYWGVGELLRAPPPGDHLVGSVAGGAASPDVNSDSTRQQRRVNSHRHSQSEKITGGDFPWDASARTPKRMILATLPRSWSDPSDTIGRTSPAVLAWLAHAGKRKPIPLAALPWLHDYRTPERITIATATLLRWNLAPDSSCPPFDFAYYAKPKDAAVKALLPPAPLAALAALPAADPALRAAMEPLVARIQSGQSPAPQALEALAAAIQHSPLPAADLYPLSCSLAFITDDDFVHTFRPLLAKAQAEFAAGGADWPDSPRTVAFATQMSMLYGNDLFHGQSDWTTLESLYGLEKDHLPAGSKERTRAWFLCAEAYYMQGWTDPPAAQHAGDMYVEMINSPAYAAFNEKDKAKADWAAGIAYFAAADYSPAAIYLKKAADCPATQYFTRDALRCDFESLTHLNRVAEAREVYKQYVNKYQPGFSQGIEMATAIEDAEIRRSHNSQ